MYIEGIYLDGKTSKRYHARLEVLPDTNQTIFIHFVSPVSEESEKVELILAGIKIESRLGNTPREISFGESQLFVTEDSDAIDELLKIQGQSKSTSLLHRLETSSSLILFATIMTIAFTWAIVEYGIPKSAKFVVFQFPELTSEKFSNSLAILDKSYFEPSKLTESRQQEIHALVSPYLRSYEKLNPKLVHRSGMKANAFALPDSSIVLTDDFVNLVEKDEELLAVIFHELGHLKHKHIARQALQDSMVTLLIILITWDLSAIDLVTGLPVLLMDLSYSREFEKEADNFALEQMHRFGISVDHFAIVMQRLDNFYLEKTNHNKKSIPDFLSTHPATEDRVKLVDQFKTNL